MIHFEHPIAFILILTIPLLYILRRIGLFSRISFPLTISDWGGKSFSYKNTAASFAEFFSQFFAILGFISLVVSLANPIIRHQEKVYTSRGTDILFVVDTSPSMAARDISLANGVATRLEAAKIGIKTLSSAEKGASYGLVAMASEAACIVPPTNDIDLFLKRLESLAVGEFGEGSAIGIGLSTAVYHLAASQAPKKCIVLITDGENNAGSVHPETAATLATENGITLYTLGIGTKGSVPIEYIDPRSGKIHSGFYESDFDSGPLEAIAFLSGGKYFGIESMSSLSESLSQIAQKEDSVRTFHYRSNDTNSYSNFLFIAGILFLAALFIRRIMLTEII